MGEVAQEFVMIDLYYVATDMTSKYVLTGLKVAQELGGMTVTVQKPGLYSAEKAVLSHKGRNLCIVETEWVSALEHETCLRRAIAEIKNG